jgi:uncharacterized protein YqeY
MELKAEIQQAVKSAMKSGDTLAISTLRFLLSAIHNEEIRLRRELTTEEIQKSVATLAKQRNESIASFRKGGREELAQKEEAELAILQKYLPRALTEEQLRSLIQETIGELGAKGMGDLGRVMKQVMPKVSGRSDGKRVNELAKELLSS